MTTQSKEVIKVQESFSYFDPNQFETMQRVCKMFAMSELVPDMYKVSATNSLEKAMANCMIAVETSQRIGASPLMIMQNMIIIYGRPSWSSKFLISTVNTCGRFNALKFRITEKGKIGDLEHYEYEWDAAAKKKLPKKKIFDGKNIENLECVAYTSEKGGKDVLESSPVSIELAIKEGWYTKSGSKWATMARQMLMYRAASFWTSIYAPELSMGMKTDDEVRDFIDVSHEDVTVIKSKQEIDNNANQEEIGFDVKEEVKEDNVVPEAVPVEEVKEDKPKTPGF
jgi:hypothetical protein